MQDMGWIISTGLSGYRGWTPLGYLHRWRTSERAGTGLLVGLTKADLGLSSVCGIRAPLESPTKTHVDVRILLVSARRATIDALYNADMHGRADPHADVRKRAIVTAR